MTFIGVILLAFAIVAIGAVIGMVGKAVDGGDGKITLSGGGVAAVGLITLIIGFLMGAVQYL